MPYVRYSQLMERLSLKAGLGIVLLVALHQHQAPQISSFLLNVAKAHGGIRVSLAEVCLRCAGRGGHMAWLVKGVSQRLVAVHQACHTQ